LEIIHLFETLEFIARVLLNSDKKRPKIYFSVFQRKLTFMLIFN